MSNTYLDELNDIQRQAVTTIEGPVMIVAGPGSGKTRVLTYRIAHLINEGVQPYHILALTFTNKAAREMKERIEKVVGSNGHQVWAGTFHSIFAKLLRIDADKLGYPSNFTIYDSQDTQSLVTDIVKDRKLDPKAYPANELKSRISSAKSNLISPEAYQNDAELVAEDRKMNRPFFGEIYQQYCMRCKRSGAMDFDDLLYNFHKLLNESEDVLTRLRQKFRYIMVDEFQDTNPLQYDIVRKLAIYKESPRNICIVGDDAQSIYAFRGATIQNIFDFRNDFKVENKDFDVKIFKLEQNYRSTEHIVQAANEVIKNNSRQIKKKIWTDKGDGDRIRVFKCMTDSEEGKRVVDSIMEQKNRFRLHNNDIAILYRTNAQSRIFEEMLRRYNVPCKVYGGLSFYSRKEIKDVLSYLRILVNPSDDEALRRIINYPSRKIGATSLQKIMTLSNELSCPAFQIVANAGIYPDLSGAKAALKGFTLLIESFQRRLTTDTAYDIAYAVVRQSGIWNELRSDQTLEGIARLDNVNALLDGIKDFTESDVLGGETDKSLGSYLQQIALFTDADKDGTNDDHVALMSVHNAKGLEFKSVFVVGMEENLFPSYNATREGADGMDEERRLFYVAITRAEKYLTLSYANTRYRFGQLTQCEPSRFMNEIPEENYDSMPFSTPRATVSGILRTKTSTSSVTTTTFPDFKPSPPSAIQAGVKVLHQRFGIGTVQALDGKGETLVATIFFKELSEQKRIVLKFAKLQVLP